LDTIKTIKCKLKDILHPENNYDFLFNSIKRADRLIFINYHFIRSYILYQHSKERELPQLNKDFVRICFKILCKKSCGPKSKRMSNMIKGLEQFYINKFVKKMYPDEEITLDNINDFKFDATNLSYIYGVEIDEIVKSYKNNIKLNFFKYVHQYVNQSLKWYKT
jgi:hypothetical protein